MFYIANGKFMAFIILLLIVAFILISIYVRGQIKIRRIIALEAIDEVIKRSVEMGRPIFISCGRGGITDQNAQQTVAGFNILTKVSTLCAQLNAKLIHIVGNSEQLPSVQDIMTQAYQSQNQELDQNYSIRFVGNDQTAYMSTIMGMYERERPAANIIVGAWYWESIMLTDGAASVGAMSIGGTARIYHMPYMAACCDYSFIGEELFAAGAYLSGDERMIGSIRGQDLSKLLVLGLLILVFISTLLGNNFISSLLKM
jgi:hypothetical protein